MSAPRGYHLQWIGTLAMGLALLLTSCCATNSVAPLSSPAQAVPVAVAEPTLLKTDEQVALPALYVLGDSTAAKNNNPVIQVWGTPFLVYFDPSKINVVNAARGGRSSRTFITEGLLDAFVAKLKPGDTVLVQFGHNDVFPLNDRVARGTLHGLGEETEEIDNQVTGKHEVVHTYGWYMRKFVNDIRAKGANPIILTLTIRDRWNKDGTIERLPVPNLNLDNTNRFTSPSIYSIWAAEVAKAMNVPLIDVHNIIADRYDKEGTNIVSTYFNSPRDPTHRNPLGAAVDAEITLAGLKALEGTVFDVYLSDKGKAVPAADAKYIFPNSPTTSKLDLQFFEFAKGSLNEQEDRPDTGRTGKVVLCLAGDSTVAYSSGYAAGMRSHFDKQLQVINRSRGGRTTANFRKDGRWDDILKIKPDYVMIQFGHNDGAVMNDKTYAENLACFVDEARADGIKPILVTPVSRRYWQPDGTIKDDLANKVAAMRQVATDKKVPLMELHERAVDLYLKVGKEVSNSWGLPKPDPAHPGTTILDKTHFNAKGSAAMGKVAAAELKRAVPELAPYID